MIRCILLGIFSLLVSFTAWSQPHDYRSSFKKAETLFNLENPTPASDSIAIVLYLESSGPALEEKNGKIALSSLINAATIHQTHHKFKEASLLYNKALYINHTYFRDTVLLYEASLYLGSVYYQQGITDSAKFYFESASDFILDHPERNSFPEQERLYNSLGALYYESANFNQAMNYFEKALEFDKGDKETQVTLQSNIANCLVQLSQYDDGIIKFKSLLPTAFLKRIVLHNIAHAFFKTGKYDSALHYFNKVSRLKDDVTIRMLNDIGRIHIYNRNYAAANKTLDSSIRIINSLTGNINLRDRAMNFLARSVLEEQQNHYPQAMKWCEDALAELQLDITKQSDPYRDVNTISPILSLDIIKQHASLKEKEFIRTRSPEILQSCFNSWLKAIHVANYARKYLDNDEAKLYFQQDQGNIYYEAIRIGFALNDIRKGPPVENELIGIMESYKGNILYENIQQAELKSGSSIPVWIREKEKSLKQSLSYYTVKLGNAPSTQQTAILKQNIINARVELSRLQKQYEQHPEYELFKHDTSVSDYRKKLSASLDKKTALLSFMTSEENIYALAITKNGFQTAVIQFTPQLKYLIEWFNKEVYQHTEGKRYEGTQPGSKIYQAIVAPFEKFIAGSDKLIIFPDGLLNYISFEALASGESSRDYFLLQKTISYHYSISLLLYNNDKKYISRKQTDPLFFAPFTTANNAFNTAGISLLPFSMNEVTGQKTTRWLGEKATKINLLNNIGNSRVIHLATHAKSGNDENGNALIYFFPVDSSAESNNLYLEEIYSLELHNTDLVVLSACETAGGTNASGEGLLSLSRGFMYAGSKGMISTLWKTEDQVSAKLMQQFYAEMADGYSVEEALQRAKILFLEDESVSEKYKTPNYWANFIYVGKTSEKKYHFKSPWIFGIVLLISGIVYVAYKRRKLPAISG